MDIFNVECPDCGKVFYADMLLYSLDVELHCPFCGIYFLKKDSPNVVTGGETASAVARLEGGLKKDMIYKPEPEEEV